MYGRPARGAVLTALFLSFIARSAAAGPLSMGNLLVSQDDVVRECTPAGVVVQTFAVPYGGGVRPGTESVRDLVIGASGKLHIYDGTFAPFLTTLDPAAVTWSSITHPEWSTVNNVSYGGIARSQGHVFVTDMATAGGQAKGIVRFDPDAGTALRFASSTDYIDLTVGLDGLLYAVVGSTVHVHDPSALTLVRTFSLATACRGIAVNAAGHVFGAAWDGNIYHFDPNGMLLASVPTGASNLSDIDLDTSGHIVVGGRFGQVIQTDTTLASLTTFVVSPTEAFVAFVSPGCVNGAACDDGDPCTTGDQCQNDICAGIPKVCAPSDPCHGAGTCDPVSGACTNPSLPDGTPCEDGSACTQVDGCQAGICTGGIQIVCPVPDACHEAGICDPQTGVCSSSPKADGAVCDDGDACTTSDACQGGACAGVPVVCVPSDACHDAGVCEPGTGCTNPAKVDGAACDDGNPCTQVDTCMTGICSGGVPVVCAALDDCHEDGTCDVQTGLCVILEKPDGTPCPEGTCSAGACEPGGGGTGGTGAGGMETGGGGAGAGGSGTGGTGTGGAGAGGSGTGGTGAAGNDQGGGVEDGGGCGCRTDASAGGSPAFVTLLGLLGMAWRRRRVRRTTK